MFRSIITGCGSYLPTTIRTNDDVAQMVDTTDEWISERTGIKQRHIAADNELTSDLATHAAKAALAHAKLDVDAIDLIILATTTPDKVFPSTATKIQANLGIKQAIAFDIQAVCSGFIYALSVADNFIKTGQAKNALVIGADILSRIVDWEDRTTCVLFGDGAGAVVIESANHTESKEDRGILSTDLYADGSLQDILYVEGGTHGSKDAAKIKMLGQDVYKHAVEKMTNCVKAALAEHQLSTEDIDYLVPHQANQRIIAQVGKRLKLNDAQVILTVDKHANTSAASIPLALDDAIKQGKITPGKLLILEALGGGLTWGTAVVRW